MTSTNAGEKKKVTFSSVSYFGDDEYCYFKHDGQNGFDNSYVLS